MKKKQVKQVAKNVKEKKQIKKTTNKPINKMKESKASFKKKEPEIVSESLQSNKSQLCELE